jgi:hypothetical protein
MTEDDVEGLTDEEVHLLNASIVKTMLDFKRTNGEFHFALFVLTRKNDQDTEAATDLISYRFLTSSLNASSKNTTPN